jgi:hypothetical protein
LCLQRDGGIPGTKGVDPLRGPTCKDVASAATVPTAHVDEVASPAPKDTAKSKWEHQGSVASSWDDLARATQKWMEELHKPTNNVAHAQKYQQGRFPYSHEP